MKIISNNFNLKRLSVSFFSIIFIFFITACAVPEFAKPKKVDNRTRPVNADERARQNIEEGRGISLKGALKGGKTTYEFNTSNPLWRASLETIDFLPLSTVDYSGGIIVTDWYSEGNNPDESIKITVRFLSNEIQSNSVKVIIHNKKCSASENCTVNEIDSNIKLELQKTIIKKAALLEKQAKEIKKK